jgi:hypothetical protein
MSANDLTVREQCDRFCSPGGDSGIGYDSEGDVFRCQHGVVRRCSRNTGWRYWSDRRKSWLRLSRFWTPIRYRRACAALALSEVEGA